MSRPHGIDWKFGKLVREWRKDIGMSQAVLAGRLGMSQAMLSRHEKGMCPWTLDQVIETAGVFDVTTCELIRELGQ